MKHFIDTHKWWFSIAGIGGNLLFFIGSICFLNSSTETFGVWLFILGSGMMLASSLAKTVSSSSNAEPQAGRGSARRTSARQPVH